MAEIALSPLTGNVRELEQLARRLLIDWGDAAQVRLPSLRAGGSPAQASSPVSVAPGAAGASPEPRRYFPSEGAHSRSPLSEPELLDALEKSDWKPSRAARLLGVSRSTIYASIHRSPTLATAAALSAEEIQRQLAAHSGDLDRVAKALRVSRRGLVLRLRELEAAGGEEKPLLDGARR